MRGQLLRLTHPDLDPVLVSGLGKELVLRRRGDKLKVYHRLPLSTPRPRAKTAAIAAVIQSCIGILFSYTVPLLPSNQGAGWGQKIGVFFAGLTLVFLIAVVYMYPETKNRTYQELDELFDRKIPAWRFASTKTAYQTGIEIQESAEA